MLFAALLNAGSVKPRDSGVESTPFVLAVPSLWNTWIVYTDDRAAGSYGTPSTVPHCQKNARSSDPTSQASATKSIGAPVPPASRSCLRLGRFVVTCVSTPLNWSYFRVIVPC